MEFSLLLDFIAQSKLFTDKKKLLIRFTKLMPSLLQEPRFSTLLAQSIDLGETYPDIVMEAYE